MRVSNWQVLNIEILLCLMVAHAADVAATAFNYVAVLRMLNGAVNEADLTVD